MLILVSMALNLVQGHRGLTKGKQSSLPELSRQLSNLLQRLTILLSDLDFENVHGLTILTGVFSTPDVIVCCLQLLCLSCDALWPFSGRVGRGLLSTIEVIPVLT